MANRIAFENLSEKMTAEALVIEERLFEIVSDAINERDSLRQKVKVLEQKIDNFDQQHAVDEHDDVGSRAKADFVKLMREFQSVRLSDSEMLKLATLSKLKSEVRERHAETSQGIFFEI